MALRRGRPGDTNEIGCDLSQHFQCKLGLKLICEVWNTAWLTVQYSRTPSRPRVSNDLNRLRKQGGDCFCQFWPRTEKRAASDSPVLYGEPRRFADLAQQYNARANWPRPRCASFPREPLRPGGSLAWSVDRHHLPSLPLACATLRHRRLCPRPDCAPQQYCA